EAKVEFEGSRRAAVVNMDIPDDLGPFLRLDEYFISRNYGLNIETAKQDRRAEWSTRRAQGSQRLYYRIEVVPRIEGDSGEPTKAKVPKAPSEPIYQEPLASAI